MAGGTATSSVPWSNWAGNQRGTSTILRPGTTAEVVEAVRVARAAGGRIRAVGSGHSFTPVALADDRRMELAALDTGVRVDREGRLVTVPRG